MLEGLAQAGFDSQLVGGCVRDLMLGREPKDFDVVTDAHPEQVRRVFNRARLIGRRFRLAHVRFGRDVIEVATYRALPDAQLSSASERTTDAGRLISDNVYGTRAEDALRRDFTVNALYLDSRDYTVIDHVGGVDDLQQGVLRVIGDPEVRFREDPVRMLRAIRFAAKLGFRIEDRTAAPIIRLAPLLRDVPPARLFDEVLKLFHGGTALETYELLRKYRLFGELFPSAESSLEAEAENFPLTLLPRALASTDARINAGKPVTPAFLFAAVLWEPVRLDMQRRMQAGVSEMAALEEAAGKVLADQLKRISIPRRFSTAVREIWRLQPRLLRRTRKRISRVLEHPRFRAAYDFMLLRAEVGEAEQETADWWTRIQEADEQERAAMVAGVTGPAKRRRRRRPRRRRNPGDG